MNKEQLINFLILKLKDEVTSKEMVNIRASRDLSEFGKWQIDYDAWVRECQDTIYLIITELESLK